MQVDLGGLDAWVAEPEGDDRGVDTDGEQAQVWRKTWGVTVLVSSEGHRLAAVRA